MFFDLEKAYDTAWRYGILKDNHKLGFRGRLPTFIENFLADRTTKRLGHTRVTHSYLLLDEEQPQCVGCDAPFTVHHFLLECGDFAQVRNNCFHVDNMKELFQDIHIDSIMTFLRQINLFNKI